MNLHFPGIYEIVHIETGKPYGGQAVDIHERWVRHRRELRQQTHPCKPLQRAWNKYGADAFEFRVIMNLSYISKDELEGTLDVEEQKLIASYGEFCYNTMKVVEHGFVGSPEHKEMFSKFHKSLWENDEHRAKRIAAITNSYDEKLRAERQKVFEEYYSNPEHREAVSIRATKMWQNPEHRETQSEKRKANWQNPEYLAQQKTSRTAAWQNPKIRERRGTAISKALNRPEVKAKRSEAIRAAWAKKKAAGETVWSEERKKAHSEAIRTGHARRKAKKEQGDG